MSRHGQRDGPRPRSNRGVYGGHRRSVTEGDLSNMRSNRNRTRSLDLVRRDAPYSRDRSTDDLRAGRNVSVAGFMRDRLDQAWSNALVLSQASINIFKYHQQEPQSQLPRNVRDSRILREEMDKRRPRPMTSGPGESRSVSNRNNSGLSRPPTRVNTSVRNGVSAPQRPTMRRDRSRPGNFHESPCPIPRCNVKSSKLKNHMLANHLPFFFKDKETEKELQNEMLHQKRADALQQLAHWILGPRQNVAGLAGLINRRKLIPSDSKILGSSVPAMRLLCNREGWRVPPSFSLHPVNSPAALLHWRALAALVSLLTPVQREIFKHYGQPERNKRPSDRQDSRGRQDLHPVNHHDDVVDRETAQARNMFRPELVPEGRMWDFPPRADRHMLGPAIGPVVDIPNMTGQLGRNLEGPMMQINQEVQIPLLPAVDCFYHLDKTAMELWGNQGNSTTDKVLLYGPKPPAGYAVDLVGGVQVYSDPATYPADIPSTPKWKVALGVHPMKGHLLTDDRFGYLIRLMATKDVSALGVIGLDRSAPFDTWIQQEKVFRELLKFAKDNQPLIIHVRGQINDPYAADVHARCLKILQECRPKNQLLHLHCFRGMKEQVVDWLTAFPNTHFGFTAKCIDFDEHQLQALRAVPTDRILIESNSPRKWPALGVEITTPAMIGAVGMVVATQGNYNCQELMHVTTANARRLYNI